MIFQRLSIFTLPALLAFLLLAGPATAADMTGYDIAVKMDNVDSSKDSYSEAVMTINSEGKTLTRVLKTYSKRHYTAAGKKDKQLSLIVFDKPTDVAGTKYLVWSYEGLGKEDDMWVYLPAENLERRISGSNKYASFMRSDLSNEDIQELDDVDEYTYTLKGSETVDGVDCYILERTPKPGKNTQYSKQVQWVRKDNFLRQKGDYYDKKGKLIRKFSCLKNEKIDDIWTVTRLKVERPGEGSSTTLELSKVKYNGGVDDSYFEQSKLKR
jgi:outer membrane lipoprotein-sorting protein